MSSATATARSPLDRVGAGTSLLDSLRAGSELRSQVATGVRDDPDELLAAFAAGDPLARILLMPALAALGLPAATSALLAAIGGADPAEREHAAWALAEGAPVPAALGHLQALRAAGGFPKLLAELTLDGWRPSRLRPEPPAPAGPPGRHGLRIVQVFMQGWVDSELTRAGAGDGGGLATLLVHLSAALAARPEVETVVTLTRSFAGEDVPSIHATSSEPVAPGATIERIPFGGDGYLATADLWPHRRELEQGLERALRRLAPVDAVHVRFADVATLAAARVCERLGIPLFFTLAPDPHALIRRRELRGELDRDGFVRADLTEHLLFRARLVERLRDQATGLALLPRATARLELEQLVGLPADGRGFRVRTVPEGISIASVDAAAHAAPGPPRGAVADLDAAVRALPRDRQGLPLILSVGRLHRVKGFVALLDAWAGAPDLRRGYNLAIVGGDLERPTLEERAVLDALSASVRDHPGAGDGLILLGHRPHREVIRLMAAARSGIAGSVGPAGVYACASEKEEFGLALVEAMASGLSVVGPAQGGPPTFIDDGVTGTITDTGDAEGVRDGLRRAAAIRLDPHRAVLAEATVRRRFTIEAMAAGLVDLYAPDAPAASAAS